MPLADLTEDAVNWAIDEFDRLGRSAFLGTYGFGKARDYFLVKKGQAYDSPRRCSPPLSTWTSRIEGERI
jgi:hypothetical protein